MRIEVRTEIAAPMARVFDLARCIELHVASASSTDERAIGGVTSGLIGLGQEVTFRARHLGVTHSLTAVVTVFECPRHFRDTQVRGPFRRLVHDHFFTPTTEGTSMRDLIELEAPLGVLGRVAERLVLAGHLRRFLIERNALVKATAESNRWRDYLAE